MKLKSFCTTKEMVSKLKRPPQSGRKYLLAIYQTRDQKSEYIGSSNEPLQNQ
jgi:hypothetical protein